MVPAHDAAHGVAIIGVSCRFPGARDLEAFWTLLREGGDAVSAIDARRWAVRQGGGESIPHWAGLIDGVDEFDAEFFQISPREARQMDPQQRLLLQETWHCLEDAAVTPSNLRRACTAVFVGTMAADYRQRLVGRAADPESFSFLGNAGALLANRISHVLGLRGESKTIDAACASSLVALHDARRALENGEADFALVAAANVICHPWKHDSFARAHMLSPTGRCRTFSAEADGYVPGEGAAVLLLQRLPDARRARRRIYGVMRGSAVNHVGASMTITSPGIAAQRDVVRAALASAGLTADAISYVEAHGTGTSLGDPIEIEALRQAFTASESPDIADAQAPGREGRAEPFEGRSTSGVRHCVVGAVKTNIGHLEAAAGLAGVIKVLLMFRERQIPPSLHCAEVNPIIDFARTPFELPTTLRDWAAPDVGACGHGRCAGVSSFGFGGVNAHVVLEEPPARERGTVTPSRSLTAGSARAGASSAWPFMLSARSEPALRDLIAAWRAFARTPAFAETDVATMCLTLACGREHGPWRVGKVVRSHDDIRNALEALVPSRSGSAQPVAVIIGPGLPKPEALDDWAAADDGIETIHRSCLGRLECIPEIGALARPAALLCALATRLRELGVTFASVTGEGEARFAALSCAGAVPIADACRLACGLGLTTPLQRPLCPVYGFGPEPLLPVRVSPDILDRARSERAPAPARRRYLELAQQLIVTQPTFARFLREWERPLGVSDMADELRGALAREASTAEEHASDLRLFVVIHACLRRLSRKWELPEVDIESPGARLLTELLVANALEPADFIALFHPDAELGRLAAAINGAFVSMPGTTLGKLAALLPFESIPASSLVGHIVAPPPAAALEPHDAVKPATLTLQVGMAPGRTRELGSPVPPGGAVALDFDSDAPAADEWLTAILTLWTSGVAIDWAMWRGDATFTPVSLPAYPFERKSYWFPEVGTPVAAPTRGPETAAVPAKISLRSPATTASPPPATDPREPGRLDVSAAPRSWPGSRRQDLAPGPLPRRKRAPTGDEIALANAMLPYDVRDGVAVIRLAGRSEHNCFTDALIAAFGTRLAQVAADSAVKTVVVTNDGPHFCAGGTTAFIDQLRRGERTFADLHCFYRGLLECPVPVVNAVAGHAFGGGLAFALFADVVVLAAESRYSANFLSLGFSPGMGATLIVPEKLGPDVGARLLYSGQTLNGHELAAAGARVQVVDRARVLSTALELARDFASQSRLALEVLKRQMAMPLLGRLGEHEERELAGHQVTLVDAAAFAGAGVSPGPRQTDTLPPSSPISTRPAPVTTRSGEPVTRVPDPALRSSEELVAGLRELAGKLLLMRPEDVDPAKPFRELGMDSVLTVELAKAIGRRWPVNVDAAVLYEHPSVARLGRHLRTLVEPAPKPVPGPAEPIVDNPGLPVADNAIAIIGMAARYPGAEDLDAFWHNLADGKDAITTVPADRWDADAVFDSNPDVPGRTNSRWGGFLDAIDQFDPLFFKIAPSEAEAMDPQQRLFLQEAWHALEHAGYGGLREARCGVFVGVSAGDYGEHLARAGRDGTAEAFMGLAPSILAARISYLLDLHGPSLAIDTACSSSLVAVHQACQSLRHGECELALAGGVTLMTTPQLHVRTGHAHMLSPTGRCRPFGADADGIVLGEGVGVVVLKPLARAIADHDTVYAVIRGSGINQDGATNGITAPSARAQEQLIRDVLARAAVGPDSISYVEAHGTGTPLGDPIELRALAAVFATPTAPGNDRGSDSGARLTLGSVKSNIGHTVCAAGVAGLIKTVLALRHGQIPPSLHFGNGNPRIDFSAAPFVVPTSLRAWPVTPGPRRAAVSSFGFSGTNAHVIIEEHRVMADSVAADRTSAPCRFTLSAQSPDALRRYIDAWRAFAARPGNTLPDLADVCFTLARGRARLPHVFSVAVRDYNELRLALDRFGLGDEGRDNATGAIEPARGRRVPLPVYPFERIRCWPTPIGADGAGRAGKSPPPAPDPLEQLLTRVCRRDLSIDEAEREIVRRELLPR